MYISEYMIEIPPEKYSIATMHDYEDISDENRLPQQKYPIMAYRKINFAAGISLFEGIIFIIFYVLLAQDTGYVVSLLFLLAVGIWLIFISFMLKKSERLILSGEVGKIRKGGKIATLFGILGLNLWAFVGGTEAMDWR